jgi:hypothetical protein
MIAISVTDFGSTNSVANIDRVEAISSGTSFLADDLAASNTSLQFDNDLNTVSNESVTFAPQMPDRWDAEKGMRFKDLAQKEAVGDISVEELVELDFLSVLRTRHKNPMKADEILWQRRQRSLTRAMIDSLKQYVEFHHVPRSA